MEDMKKKIVDFVRENGPVLPVQVSKLIGNNILFSGAILSELASKELILISYAKVGGSPVYYIPGQEIKLNLLYNYLPEKEKEAYNLLKERKILKDKDCEPSIRVALRQIKDFAKPFEMNDEIYWKWYLAPDEVKIEPKEEIKLEEKKLKEEIIEDIEIKIEKKNDKKKKLEDHFLEDVNNYLNKNNIKVLSQEIIKKNKEIHFLVKVPSNLGELNYLVILINKKKINEGDLSLAYNKGQKEKMSVLFITPGSLTKKAERYINDNLKGGFIFRKI